MKTILVPTDFSKSADNACKHAIEIAKEFNSKIILLHTFETPPIYSDVPLTTIQMDYSFFHDAASNQLKKYYAKIRKINAKIKFELLIDQGLASTQIIKTATEKKVELIVMGTTGRSAVERIFIGSNTLRVIRKAPCLLLLVPPHGKYKVFNKIVYATDLKEENLLQSKSLIPFAKAFNSEIIFLNVNKDVLTDNVTTELETLKLKINRLVRYPKTSGFICNDERIADGINFFLKKHKIDCLAIYTKHKSFFDILFKGSVARTVSLNTPVPMFVMH